MSATGVAVRRIGLPGRALAAVVRVYQLGVSPLLAPRCRFVPSCSEYAVEALREHGAVRGLWLTVRRLARCQPLCHGGWDPVPARRDAQRSAPPSSSAAQGAVPCEAPPATSATVTGARAPVPVARGARSC